MKKFFSLMSLIGLFSVLYFTNCKKKNNDNTPTAIVTATTLTGATYGWTITGLTADKPINPKVPSSTDWYKELGFAEINPNFMFNTNKSYTLSEDIGYIPSSGTWSLNDANTALTVGGLTIRFTESSDTKVVGKIAYPKYGINNNETANLTITLTKNTQSNEPPINYPSSLVSTNWSRISPDNTGVEVKFTDATTATLTSFGPFGRASTVYIYTYNNNDGTGTAIIKGYIDEKGTYIPADAEDIALSKAHPALFTISGSQAIFQAYNIDIDGYGSITLTKK